MEKNKIKRIGLRCSDIFLRWSIGYAYKSANAVLFTLLSIIALAFVYSCIDWTDKISPLSLESRFPNLQKKWGTDNSIAPYIQ